MLGLDVGGLAEAEAIAARLAPWFGVVKVGHELYAEAGPAAFDRMHELGFRIFCDLKLHDIPNTVERARTRARSTRCRVHERARGRWRDDAARVRRTARAKARPTSARRPR